MIDMNAERHARHCQDSKVGDNGVIGELAIRIVDNWENRILPNGTGSSGSGSIDGRDPISILDPVHRSREAWIFSSVETRETIHIDHERHVRHSQRSNVRNSRVVCQLAIRIVENWENWILPDGT